MINFNSIYNPHIEVSVDEAMIKFKGRSKITQYIPLKPVKRGIKVWILADSVNGYIVDFKVYIGKEGDTVQRNLGIKVVTDITSTLPKGHHVYFDNYFTLLQYLLDHDLYSCGTFRLNRVGIPSAIKNLKERK